MPRPAILLVESSEECNAYVACALKGASPQTLGQRVKSAGLLIAKFRELASSETANVNLEIRYIVRPKGGRTSRVPPVEVFLIARLSDRGCDHSGLKQLASGFAQELEKVLADDGLPLRFVLLTRTRAIAKALHPFPINDLYDVRPPARLIRQGLSFPGIPNAEVIVRQMLKASNPTVLTIAIQTASLEDAFQQRTEARGPEPMARDTEDEGSVCKITPGYASHAGEAREISVAELNAVCMVYRSLSELRDRAYIIGVHMASSGPIGRALLSTLKTEFGGPGYDTIEDTVFETGSSVTAPAICVKPRNTPSGRLDQLPEQSDNREGGASVRKRRSEWDIAEDNLTGVGLEDWGERPVLRIALPASPGYPLALEAHVGRLASYRTTAKVFMFPRNPFWLGDDPPPGSFRPLRPR